MAKSKACTCRTRSLVCLSVCMVFGILFIYFALDMVDCNTDTKKIWEKGKNKKLDFQSSWHWSQPTLSLSLSLSLSGFCHLSPLQQSSSGLVLVHQYLSQSVGTGVGPLCCSCHIGALTISFCFALFKSKQLIDKASHYIYIYIYIYFFLKLCIILLSLLLLFSFEIPR